MTKFEKVLAKIELLSEAPIGDFELAGDWGKSDAKRGYNKQDIGILTHPKTEDKFRKFWKGLKYEEVDMYFLRKKGANDYSEFGTVAEEWVQETFDWPEFKAKEDNITIIYTNNVGAEKVPMTAWTAAHRYGHAMQSAARRGQGDFPNNFKEIERTFGEMLNIVLEDYGFRYRLSEPYRGYDREVPDKLLGRILGKIGTFRSARMDKIARPYEFIHEMVAQYINSGEITFNEDLQPVSYDREKRNFTKNDDYDLGMYARTFEYYIGEMIRSSEGSIFVM